MDPQIAAQFLGNVMQATATVVAIYLAILIYVFQERHLANLRSKRRFLVGTIVILGLSFGLLFSCISDYLDIMANLEYSYRSALFASASLLILLFAFLLTVVFIILARLHSEEAKTKENEKK